MLFHDADPTSLSILLIEDDPSQQRLIRHRLERESFQVVTASSAIDAIDLARNREFAIAIVDLGLPDTSGLDLVREFQLCSNRTKIIIFSAQVDFKLVKESLNLGVIGYVEKSEDLRILIEHVHNAATKHLNEVLSRAEGEIRFQMRLLDAVEDGIVATNLNFDLIYVNRYAEELMNLSDRESIGMNVIDFLFIRKSHRKVNAMVEQLRAGLVFGGQVRVRIDANRSTGSALHRGFKIDVRFTASPILDASNSLSGFVIAFADITRERRLQHSLQAIAAQQSVVAEIATSAISAEHLDTFIQNVTSSICRSLHMDSCTFEECKLADESLSSSIGSQEGYSLASDEIPEIIVPDLAPLQQDHEYCTSIRIVLSSKTHPVGLLRLYSSTPRSLSESDKLFLRSVLRIIANTLARFRATYRWESLYENSLSAIVLMNDEGVCIDANAAATNLVGYSREELCSMPLHQVLVEHEFPDFDSLLKSLLKIKRIEGEVKLQSNTASIKTAKYIAVSDVLPGLHMFDFRDITIKKELEEKIHQDLGVLAHFQRNAAIGQMAAVLAHEINQPLGAIANFIGGLLISDCTLASSESKSVLSEVQDQAIRAGLIVKRLRRFIAKSPQESDSIEINQLIRDTSKLMRSDLRMNQVDLEIDLQEDLPPIKGDAIQIQQVLVNLVKNAIEAMSQSPTTNRKIRFSSHTDGEEIAIKIADNGPGASDRELAKIFDRTLQPRSTA